MKQINLFDRFNSSPEDMLRWLAAEQKAGRLYSRRELLRMSVEDREAAGAPTFSRSGLVGTVRLLIESGRVSRSGTIYGKIVVADVPLPIGSACFLG